VDLKRFVSFKKVACDLKSPLEIISYHSVSKGMYGECGWRGGYMEALNLREEIVAQMYKAVSISLSPNVIGQIGVELLVNPSKKGEPSYEQFQREYNDIFQQLKRKAVKVQQALNSLPGMSCNTSEGAMYLFPRVYYPPKFIEAARQVGKHPDVVYALELLNETGICTVPGNGFGQEEGTFHFRTTFLPTEELIDIMIANLSKFQRGFMARYGGASAKL
jgi:aspartate/methionine/tyrosine aminotransferase